MDDRKEKRLAGVLFVVITVLCLLIAVLGFDIVFGNGGKKNRKPDHTESVMLFRQEENDEDASGVESAEMANSESESEESMKKESESAEVEAAESESSGEGPDQDEDAASGMEESAAESAAESIQESPDDSIQDLPAADQLPMVRMSCEMNETGRTTRAFRCSEQRRKECSAAFLDCEISSSEETEAEYQVPFQKVDPAQAGFLGITCMTVPDEFVESGYPKGVCVVNVLPGCAADAAGIMSADVITALNGIEIPDSETMKDEIAYYAAGEKVEVSVERLNAERSAFDPMKITAVLSSREEINENNPLDESESGADDLESIMNEEYDNVFQNEDQNVGFFHNPWKND